MLRLIASLTAALLLTSSAQAYHFFSGGQLYIAGTSDDDVIVVEIIRPRMDHLRTIGIAGRTDYRSTGTYEPLNTEPQVQFTITDVRGDVIETASYNYADVDWLNIHGKDGNDFIFNDTDLPSNMTGGRGSDTLSGGSGPDDMNGDSPLDDQHWDDPDILFGNGGDDELIGGGRGTGFLGLVRTPAADELYGGPGRDVLYGQSGAGLFFANGTAPNDLLDGESDRDTYYYFDWDFLAEFNSFGIDVIPDEPQTLMNYSIAYR